MESKIWTEGILSTIMRDVSRSELDFYEWIIFDGPVDPIWIESMNTVLDENNKPQLYKFEGYRIFQLKDGSVGTGDLDDIDKAREIFTSDIKNNIIRLVNLCIYQCP